MQKLIRSALGVALVAALLPMAPSKAEAQSASITATAIVAGTLTVTALRSLDFGTVIPGVNRTVLETDPTSGHFQLAGGVNAEVLLTYSALPATLLGPGAPMPVSFTATHNTLDAGGVGTVFTPSAGLTTRLDGVSGLLHIYMGGTVTVAVAQTAGTYTETITLDAAYTGN